MKRPVRIETKESAGGLSVEADGSLKKLAPTLWEFLTHDKYDDGSDRVTGTCLLLKDDGVIKAWLNDKDVDKSCWISGDSWDGLLRAAEKALNDPGTAWRTNKPYTGKKGKK